MFAKFHLLQYMIYMQLKLEDCPTLSQSHIGRVLMRNHKLCLHDI